MKVFKNLQKLMYFCIRWS